jgi:hypothetical protein
MKNMLKSYKTIEVITHINNENITNRFKADFSQNPQKGQNITKPTVSKPLIDFSKLQNGTYLLTKNYKTNSFIKVKF